MKINKIELSVKNLEESIKFYQEAFGFEVVFKGTTGLGEAANLKCGDFSITLMETPKIPIGIFGMGLDASEKGIDADVEELKSKGARVVMEPSRVGKGVIAKLFDPSDISITITDTNFDKEDSGDRVTHLPNKIK